MEFEYETKGQVTVPWDRARPQPRRGSVGEADRTQVREEAAVAGVVEGPWARRVSAPPQGDTPRSPFIPRVLIECPLGDPQRSLLFLVKLTACGGDTDINQMSRK